MTDEEILTVWRKIAKVDHLVLGSDTIQAVHACIKLERERCAKICHERYMELEHGTSRGDPLDDYENGLQSAIAKELRDKIMERK